MTQIGSGELSDHVTVFSSRIRSTRYLLGGTLYSISLPNGKIGEPFKQTSTLVFATNSIYSSADCSQRSTKRVSSILMERLSHAWGLF